MASSAREADPYLTLINTSLIPLEKTLRVLSAPQSKLIATFKQNFPSKPSSSASSSSSSASSTAALLYELMDIRGLTSRDQEKLVKSWNASVGEKSSKRIEWVQRDFMTNFFGDIKKTISTNL